MKSSPKGFDVEFDHVGIAVPSLDANSVFWRALGWQETPSTEVVEGQKVKVAMYPLKNSGLSGVAGTDESRSPVAEIHVDKRGPGIHHICFRVKKYRPSSSKTQKRGREAHQ